MAHATSAGNADSLGASTATRTGDYAVGAPWVDMVGMAPSVALEGGPSPAEFFVLHPAARAADPNSVNAVLAAIAGYFTYGSLQPPVQGLPTVRAFQAAQGEIARCWLAERLGLQ